MLNLLQEQHESNYIRTTKYTAWSFLPLSLIQQFKRMANVYFLLQAVLNSIPQISAMNPVTAWSPLAFVLGVSMMREGLEDYQRYKSDIKTNRQSIMFIKGGKLSVGQAKDIKVGDLLMVNENEEFPADIVLLSSSAAEGTCYVQTSSLDGEKNLKTKKTAKNSERLIPCGSDFHPSDLLVTMTVDAEAPNGNLYSFKGNLHVGKKRYFSLSHDQLLLKGTMLKNTKHVIGFVVYTGRETRIMMNSQLGAHKQSSVERLMNTFTLTIFYAQLILTLSLAILGGLWHSDSSSRGNDPVHFYIELSYSSIFEGIFTFVRYFQLLNTLIPISLFVTTEMIKFFIAWFIMQDAEMICAEKDQGTEVKNMSIIEDLGQLHYIFTDKTGTLTCNEMEFKAMCIGEQVFGPKSAEFQSNQAYSSGLLDATSGFDAALFDNFISGRLAPKEVKLTLVSANGNEQMQIATQSDLMREFMTVMAVAHEVVAEDPTKLVSDTESEPTDDPTKLVYQGPSPDEVTLVEFARERGFSFITSNDTVAKILVTSADTQAKVSYNSAVISNSNADRSELGLRSEDDFIMEFDRKNPNIRHPSPPSCESQLSF